MFALSYRWLKWVLYALNRNSMLSTRVQLQLLFFAPRRCLLAKLMLATL